MVVCLAQPLGWEQGQVLCWDIQRSLRGSCWLRTAQTQNLWPFFFLSSSPIGWFTDEIQLGPCTLSICGRFSISKFPLKNNRESGGVLWDLRQRKSAKLHSDKGQKSRERQNLSIFNKELAENVENLKTKPRVSTVRHCQHVLPKIHERGAFLGNSKAMFSKFLFFFLLSENPGLQPEWLLHAK